MPKKMNEFIEQVDNIVRRHFAGLDEIPEEDEVKSWYEQTYDACALIYPQPSVDRDDTIKELVKQYCSELYITKKLGFAYKDETVKPWLNEAEEDIEDKNGWFYWSRYKNYLMCEKKWARGTVRTIERDTWNVLDLMANPTVDVGFERRGLVVASVQSGKTANYIGLICRAADAGYKIEASVVCVTRG